MPQQPHQGKSLVKARSLAALSAFEDEVLVLEERERELRSLPSLVVVVESPSSRPDSVTDSNFFLLALASAFSILDILRLLDLFSFSGGGPTMSSPGTEPLRKIPLTVRLVAVATREAEGGGTVGVSEEWELVVVV